MRKFLLIALALLLTSSLIGCAPSHMEADLDAAREAGYFEGYDAGYGEGYDWGYSQGYDAGFADASSYTPEQIYQHYFNQGNTYLSQKLWNNAISEFTKAIEQAIKLESLIGLKPTLADAYIQRGRSYTQRGHFSSEETDYDKAIADCTKAMEIDPNNAEAYVVRADAYGGKSRYDLAIFDCTDALELVPDNAYAYFLRGVSYAILNMTNEALDDFREFLTLSDDELRNELARDYIQKHQPD